MDANEYLIAADLCEENGEHEAAELLRFVAHPDGSGVPKNRFGGTLLATVSPYRYRTAGRLCQKHGLEPAAKALRAWSYIADRYGTLSPIADAERRRTLLTFENRKFSSIKFGS